MKKDIEKNEIIVWTEDDMKLYSYSLEIKHMHFLWRDDFEFPLKAKAKIRYRQADQGCMIEKKGDVYLVRFDKPQRAIASGQICAIYLWEEIVMSGVIL